MLRLINVVIVVATIAAAFFMFNPISSGAYFNATTPARVSITIDVPQEGAAGGDTEQPTPDVVEDPPTEPTPPVDPPIVDPPVVVEPPVVIPPVVIDTLVEPPIVVIPVEVEDPPVVIDAPTPPEESTVVNSEAPINELTIELEPEGFQDETVLP